MNRFFVGAAACSVVFLICVAFLTETDTRAAAFQKSNSSSKGKRVDELYNNNCARCHGPDGTGDTPLGHVFNAPDFTDPKWWKDNAEISSAKSLRLIVTNGKAGMPGFGKKLTRSEINQLVDRMRKFRN